MRENAKLSLILGGRRSGKSKFAEQLSDPFTKNRTYIATAQAFDHEFAQRIEAHRQARADDWHLVQAPHDIVQALRAHDIPNHFVLIDCLTLWITNLLLKEKDMDAEIEALATQLHKSQAHIGIVSNEVGLSIIPDNALSRRFADINGVANQRLAEIASNVYFIAAGLPMRLKSTD